MISIEMDHDVDDRITTFDSIAMWFWRRSNPWLNHFTDLGWDIEEYVLKETLLRCFSVMLRFSGRNLVLQHDFLPRRSV